MAERTIVGVDFSGAKTSNTTWVTDATLIQRTGILRVNNCYQPRWPRPLIRGPNLPTRDQAHQGLEYLLLGLPPGTVAALDFPFSVPRRFVVEQLSEYATTMDSVWRAVSQISGPDEEARYRYFQRRRDYFVKRHGEMIRRGDANYGGPFSPLKVEGAPVMLPMTFYGMRILHRVWENSDCQIPPLPSGNRNGPVLLETMPGVLLRIFGLPNTKYKKSYGTNKERKAIAAENRRTIRDGICDQQRTGIQLQNLDMIPQNDLDNDDCLDSLVAAIGAARWAMNQRDFVGPREIIAEREELDYARLEGWIYAPWPMHL